MQRSERLTYKTQGDATRGSHYCTGPGVRKDDVVQRLGAYEDTGLSPEEINASAPAADVQPVKHGKWIRKEGYDPRDNFYYCSECNRIINIVCGDSLSNYPYCHCGTRMDGGTDNERGEY